MKIEIELTRVTAKRVARVSATLAILGVGAVVYAKETRFSAGQTLTAENLNNNFDELYAAAAKPTITKNGKSISIGGAYCGASPTPIVGSTIGSYGAAKAICETTCSSPTAHMCDGGDLVRSLQLGIAFPSQQAWIISSTDSSQPANCKAWSDDTFGGTVWGLSPPYASGQPCTKAFPIACCD